jgi:hypothetical protein
MIKLMTHRYLVFWQLLLVTLAGGCSSLIAEYDRVAYQQAVSLKVESLALMDKAVEPYSNHQAFVDALLLNLEKAYEYDKGRPKNEVVTRQWEILKDPNRRLLGYFLQRWRDEKQLSEAYVVGQKKSVSLAYDQIIGLLSGQIKREKVE